MRFHTTPVSRATLLTLLCLALTFASLRVTAVNSATRDFVQGDQISPLINNDQSLTLKGEAVHAGIAQEWTLTIDGDGRGISTITGSYSAVTGYDGESLWRIENGAGPFNVDFAEREVWLMTLLTLVGQEGRIAMPIHDKNDVKNVEQYQLPNGSLIFEKTENRQLRAINSPAAEMVTFSADDHPTLEGIPQFIQISNIGTISEYRIVSAEIGPAMVDAHFSRPTRRMDLIFGEVPFVLRYDMKEGESKMNIIQTIKNTLGLMAKRRMGG